MDDRAEVFSTMPEQCFRFVQVDTSHAKQCSNPGVSTGQFTDAKGKKWTVDACAAHAKELETDN